MNGKLAYGRPLVVRFANEKPPVETMAKKMDMGSTSKTYQIRSASIPDPTSKSAKIAAIRRKLKDLEEETNLKKKAKDS